MDFTNVNFLGEYTAIILFFVIVIVWLLPFIWVVISGEEREIGSVSTFFIALIFTPFLAALIVMTSPLKGQKELIEAQRKLIDIQYNVLKEEKE